ncbi:uncharacterized protein LOC127122787 [Lathyrus oleraceus]|uniref:uncharacterized protein LOC127122787 n=1 Tax=Pisum sativum TaxID=3888 RepID=UPI0021CEDD02|nr:uncharacterized protein LOC127122787 [Pisum sativum]
MIKNGQEVPLPVADSVVNIIDITKVTRSGRVFSLVSPKIVEDVSASKKAKIPVVNPISAPTCQSVRISIGAHPPPEGGPTNENFVPAVNPFILGRVPVYDHHDILYVALGSLIAEMEMKVHVLEDKMKALQGPDTFGLDAADTCLVPGVKIPPKFKVPNFEKYKGVTYPKTHIRDFCRKVAAHFDDEKLLMHFFKIASMELHLSDMAPNQTQLQSLVHKLDESFKEYAHRWRELAARVQPPLIEKELVDMFMGTLHGPYLEKLIGITSAGFSDLMVASERIENCLKFGKIQDTITRVNGAKKSQSGFPNKKEGETNAATTAKGEAETYQMSYY